MLTNFCCENGDFGSEKMDFSAIQKEAREIRGEQLKPCICGNKHDCRHEVKNRNCLPSALRTLLK
jgi:hypothetical protein